MGGGGRAKGINNVMGTTTQHAISTSNQCEFKHQNCTLHHSESLKCKRFPRACGGCPHPTPATPSHPSIQNLLSCTNPTNLPTALYKRQLPMSSSSCSSSRSTTRQQQQQQLQQQYYSFYDYYCYCFIIYYCNMNNNILFDSYYYYYLFLPLFH